MTKALVLFVPPGLPVHVPDEVWYRYEDIQYAPPADEFGEPQRGSGHVELRVYRFGVIKHTPKGVWIDRYGWSDDKRFVLRDATKRFACPTKAEAIESYKARKQAQMRILRAKLQRAEQGYRLACEEPT